VREWGPGQASSQEPELEVSSPLASGCLWRVSYSISRLVGPPVVIINLKLIHFDY
jgi:hypothetical protein